MELARVEGVVVATAKVDRLHGQKLLVIDLLRADLTPAGTQIVAVDTVGAGVGEVVLAVRGSSARQTDKTAHLPTDTTIVAIVDEVVYRGRCVYRKRDPEKESDVSGQD
ncbi:MAG TPA: EutN/CcmL family microcompartment protein [Acidobacteriota bacterium]|nr:EutN/CcmL family microcompartment protein [Acidobacteriota bacterium]